jgi:glucose-fructose oxidoreductase
MQVQEGNTRLSAERGGGPLNDIGIYCVNAARYLFGDEPIEVLATRLSGDDPRFAEVDEAISAILRFPDGKVAQFTASFGASDLARYTVVGTRGTLDVENAYEIGAPITHAIDVDGRKRRKRFARRDQVAA